MLPLRSLVPLLLAFACARPAFGQAEPRLEPYQRVPALTGSLRLTGTHMNIVNLWAEGFKAIYPEIAFELSGGGSGKGATALIDRTADFAVLARPLSKDEQTALGPARAAGVRTVPVCLDAVILVVHPDNPVRGLTFAQVERVYGARPRSGLAVKTWAELGATGPLAAQAVLPIGREAEAGITGRVKGSLLGGGDFRSDLQALVGPVSVVRAVTREPSAIGFAQLLDLNAKLRRLAVGPSASELVEPTAEACAAGRYPLAHPLFLLLEPPSDPAKARLRQEFLRYLLSREGQALAAAAGLHPLKLSVAQEELARTR